MGKSNDLAETLKTPDKKKTVGTPNKVTATFRGRRKFHLHIGRDMVTFRSRETKQIPANWLKHKDWPNVAKYFIVKGV